MGRRTFRADRAVAVPPQGKGRGQKGGGRDPPPPHGRGRGKRVGWSGPTRTDRTAFPRGTGKSHGHFSVPHIHGAASEKRKTRHERDARARDLAQRTPAVGEAAADRGADGGDEAAAAGGGINVGAHAAGAAMEADEGAEAEGGGAREARAPATKTAPRRESASAPAPPYRKRPPPASAQWHGELRREPALSGRPANPPPPSGESEEEGADAEGDASPAPAPPQANNDIHKANGRAPMIYRRPMGPGFGSN